jgi:RuvA, C-terminal domain
MPIAFVEVHGGIEALREPSTTKPPTTKPSKNPGHVSRAARREVFARDGEECSFVSDTGERCTEVAFLQIDHVHARARGGTGDPANLRVLCRAHNLYEAEKTFGREHVARRIHLRLRRSIELRASTEPRGDAVLRMDASLRGDAVALANTVPSSEAIRSASAVRSGDVVRSSVAVPAGGAVPFANAVRGDAVSSDSVVSADLVSSGNVVRGVDVVSDRDVVPCTDVRAGAAARSSGNSLFTDAGLPRAAAKSPVLDGDDVACKAAPEDKTVRCADGALAPDSARDADAAVAIRADESATRACVSAVETGGVAALAPSQPTRLATERDGAHIGSRDVEASRRRRASGALPGSNRATRTSVEDVDSRYERAARALVTMGFREKEARRAIGAVHDRGETRGADVASLESILRDALGWLT